MPSGDRAESVLASARGVCQQCVRLAAVDGVGVSVVSPTGGLSTLCATDATSSAIEEMQFTLGVGPCLDAQSLGVPVFLEDLTRLSGALEQRWPGFTDLVSLTVARALFALPLRIGAIVLGAMDLYRTTPGPLSASELAAALRAADTVALVMVGLDVPDSGPLAGGGTGSAFRMEVHQAAGMVMEQMQVPIEAALLLLRGKAYAQDVSVNDVAADVVARRLVFAGEDG